MLTFNAAFAEENNFNVDFSKDEFKVELGEGETFDVDAENFIIINAGGAALTPATKTKLGGIIVGDNLKITADGTLSVDMAAEIEQDNTRPISSAQVYTTVGNINALLAAI